MTFLCQVWWLSTFFFISFLYLFTNPICNLKQLHCKYQQHIHYSWYQNSPKTYQELFYFSQQFAYTLLLVNIYDIEEWCTACWSGIAGCWKFCQEAYTYTKYAIIAMISLKSCSSYIYRLEKGWNWWKLQILWWKCMTGFSCPCLVCLLT